MQSRVEPLDGPREHLAVHVFSQSISGFHGLLPGHGFDQHLPPYSQPAVAQPVGHLRALDSQQLGEESQRAVVCLREDNRTCSAVSVTRDTEQQEYMSYIRETSVFFYINVTPIRTSPTGLDMGVSQVQDSCQDAEQLHLLVRLHTCRFNMKEDIISLTARHCKIKI